MAPKAIRDRQYFHGNRAKFIYEFLGRRYRNADDWRFMNYGFSYDDPADNITLEPPDEAERYPAQLYHFVASQADLNGKRVLDVGSGRGGDASYIHRYLGPSETTGMDFAESAMEFCQSLDWGISGLEYRAGDSMDMPFSDASFDAVVNVESSHCYPDKPTFFREVMRVLKPGGAFLYTDFTPVNEKPGPGLVEAGFDVKSETNITAGVVKALELDAERREKQVRDRVPFGLRRIVKLWAGTCGSWIFDDFSKGRRDYRVFHAVKPV